MPNPSDISTVLQNTQELINKAVDVVTRTTATQAVLEKNILITDKKINIHDKDELAHDDIREQLASMSRTMLSEPTVEGPKYIETEQEGTWTFSADALISSVKVTGYKIIDKQGNEFTIPADAHGVGTFIHAFTGERNEESFFTVTALGSYSSQSPSVEFEFTITQHLPPDLSQVEVSAPARVSYGKTYELTLTGITDPDDDFVDYSIESNYPDQVTFSKSEGIGDGETITFTLSDDLKGGSLELTVTAHDAWDMKTVKQLSSIPINLDPEVVSFSHTYPNNLTANTSILARVSGIVDPDEDEVTYDISSSISEITFSKTSGIQLNEDITISTSSSAQPGTPYTLTFTFKDPFGGQVIQTIESTINQLPVMDDFICSQEEYHVPGQTTEMSFSGVTDTDGEPILFSIQNTNPNLEFSKTEGIAPNEKIQVTTKESSVHGQIYNITVQARDTSGGVSSVTVGIRINNIIDPSNITTDIPTVIKPNTEYSWKINPVVDQDSQALKYTISCDNPQVILGNNTEIAADTTFTCKADLGEDLSRGDTINLIITANDGYEDVIKTVPVKINTLPDSSAITQTGILDTFYGGTENQATFKLSGGVDADNQSFTYEISDVPSDITISKTTGITETDNITITATKVSTATTKSFKVALKDALGEVGEKKEITFTVSPKIVTKAPKITSPLSKSTPVEVEYYSGFTMTWTAYEEMVDTDMTHTTYPWNDNVAWDTSFNEG